MSAHLSAEASEHVAGSVPAPVQRPRQIPSLDGLRALSVLLVVALHTFQRLNLHHAVPFFVFVLANGRLGVEIFFVISGYLITTLLLRERKKTRRISLKSFYVRRAFRILPPLYAYIVCVALLGRAGLLPGLTGRSLFMAFTLTQNYVTWPAAWPFEHFWSLCIEEQFYFVWPGTVVFCLVRWPGMEGKRMAARIGLAAIMLEPLLRVATVLFLPPPHAYTMFHLHSDYIMFGATGALLEGTRRFEAVYRAVARWAGALPLLLFFGFGYLQSRYQNYFELSVGAPLLGFTILMWLLCLVRTPDSAWGHVLNQPVIRWTGRLSYSMYLWQTLFLNPSNTSIFGHLGLLNTLPGSWFGILAVAVLSYYAVEQPSLRIRDRVMANLRWHET